MKDLIKNITKRLDRLIELSLDKFDGGASENAYKICKDIIEEEEKKYNNGWIPCSDRLPETDDDTLCWYEYYRFGEYNGMYQTYGIGHYYKSMDFLGGEVSNGHKCKVIAWQPLPEPYNPKGE